MAPTSRSDVFLYGSSEQSKVNSYILNNNNTKKCVNRDIWHIIYNLRAQYKIMLVIFQILKKYKKFLAGAGRLDFQNSLRKLRTF